MSNLYLHSRKVRSVFELLGSNENDITYSMGWALAGCHEFLGLFLRHVLPGIGCDVGHDCDVRLQEHGKDRGYTDIEIVAPSLHVIIEAKRGWNLPGEAQLRRYCLRFGDMGDLAVALVCMTECSSEYARVYMPTSVAGVPVVHVGWREVEAMARRAGGSHAEKRLLGELQEYLRRIVPMQNQQSNWVYVLSLSWKEWVSGLNFVQVVTERGRYFHPFGGSGWPTEPPNYLGFRYGGRLQSIHHVEDAVVERNPHRFFKEAPDQEGDPFLHYRLGTAIRPAHEVKTGGIYPSGRVWAMIDLLLTSETIKEARDKSKDRGGDA